MCKSKCKIYHLAELLIYFTVCQLGILSILIISEFGTKKNKISTDFFNNQHPSISIFKCFLFDNNFVFIEIR